MKRGNSIGRSFTGACGALTWLLLSACGPAAFTESRFTESPFSQQ